MKINFKRQPDFNSENGGIMKSWQVEAVGKPIKNEIGEELLIIGYPASGGWQHNYGDDDAIYSTFEKAKSAVIAHLEGAK